MTEFYPESCILPPILISSNSSSSNSSKNTLLTLAIQENKHSQLLETNPKNLKESKSRVGWWDPKADKCIQIQKIKDLVRNTHNDDFNARITSKESSIHNAHLAKKVNGQKNIGLQTNTIECAKEDTQQELLIQKIVTISDSKSYDIRDSQKDILLIKYLQDKKCEDALQSLRKEMDIPWNLFNQIRLTLYLNKLDFRNALLFVEYVYIPISHE